ncbi:hypothetical protein LNP56_27480 [Klebsiella pneumoniae subsp. pneumoniae]|nr:hypothetical protein [Klebsiella pneumoniae subsp. pneumoniae]
MAKLKSICPDTDAFSVAGGAVNREDHAIRIYFYGVLANFVQSTSGLAIVGHCERNTCRHYGGYQ